MAARNTALGKSTIIDPDFGEANTANKKHRHIKGKNPHILAHPILYLSPVWAIKIISAGDMRSGSGTLPNPDVTQADS